MNDTLSRLQLRQKQIGGQHYKGMVIQPMEYCYVNNIPYIDGNVIKYLTRWRTSGKGIEDLEKALHYLEFLIAEEKAKLNQPSTIKHMAPAIDPEEAGPGTPEDGGHHARQPDD